MPSTSPTALSTSASATASLPPPQAFDLLSPLHAILTRLTSPSIDLTNSSSSPPVTTSPLSIKDLATSAAAIKIQLQAARAMLQGLEDMERRAEEQEEEMRWLDIEVERKREVLEECTRRGIASVGLERRRL